MSNTELVTKFYTAFANADAEAMASCYSDNIQFEDPAFGILKNEDAKNMWRMLVGRSKGQIKISFSNIQTNEKTGSANWRAEYVFGDTGRKVINVIAAEFEFENGKIVKHTDHFDMWKWSRQALGLKGFLLGWTPFMQRKIQQRTGNLLRSFVKK